MKKIYMCVLASTVMLFTACGGGGGGSSAGSSSNTVLSFQNQDLTTMNSVALTKNNIPIASARSSKIMSSKVYTSAKAVSDTNESTIVAEDTVDIYPIYPVTLDIDYFALPTVIRGGATYLVTSGGFNVTNEDDNNITCNVLVSDYDGSTNVKCLYSVNDDESTVIPVAVIRDGWVDGDLEDFDSVYFVVNKLSGGFTVYKYNGTSLYPVESSDSGKITELLYGQYAIFGYDGTGSSASIIFRNEQNVLEVIDGDIAGIPDVSKPLIYKYLAMYLDRDTVDYGIQPLVFDLDQSASTTYSPSVTVDCKVSLANNSNANHNHGVIWISNDNLKLCEAYELDRGTPTQLAFRFLDQSATWESIKISNDVLVGIATFSGTQRLIVEPIDFTLQASYPIDKSAKVYDFNNELVNANLDSVTSLQYYIDGIVINGIKDGFDAVRYCNTSSGDCIFETLSTPPIILEERTDIPQ